MSYRDDVEALRQRVRSLEADVSTSGRKLDEARHLLEDAQKRDRLPVLDNLHVAAPCKASWNDMVGDDRTRFCGQCDKNVYNLSAMSRPEAEALLVEKEGRLCVRYYQRADGTVLTADCPDGLRRRRRRKRVVAAAFGAMSAVAAAGSFLHRSARMGATVDQAHEQPPMLMGAVAPPPVPVMGDISPVEPVVMGRMSVRPATVALPPTVKPHHGRTR